MVVVVVVMMVMVIISRLSVLLLIYSDLGVKSQYCNGLLALLYIPRRYPSHCSLSQQHPLKLCITQPTQPHVAALTKTLLKFHC